MWELWSKALESLGRFRLLRFGRGKTKLRVGDPAALDAQGGGRWASYLEAEKLYDTWGPVRESPWIPFHCVLLFAALDRIPRSEIGPMPGPEAGPTTWTRKGLVMPTYSRRVLLASR